MPRTPGGILLPNHTKRGRLLADLAEYFPLSNTSGINGTALTNNNTVTFTAGQQGNAATLVAASSQSLSVASNAALTVGVNLPFTLAAWVKLTATASTQYLVMKGTATTAANHEYYLRFNTTSTRFQMAFSDGTNAIVRSANDLTTINAGTWYFVGGFYLPIDATSGLNGAFAFGPGYAGGITTAVQTLAGAQSAAQVFRLGTLSGGGGFLGGQLDEVGLWKRVLSPRELRYLYNLGRGRTHPFR